MTAGLFHGEALMLVAAVLMLVIVRWQGFFQCPRCGARIPSECECRRKRDRG